MNGHDRDAEDRRLLEHFRAIYQAHRLERERSGESPSAPPAAPLRCPSAPSISITARVTGAAGLVPDGIERPRSGASEHERSSYVRALRNRFARAAREGCDEGG
jgi:hypothetical protein